MKEKLTALKKEWDIMKISINAINSFNGKLYNEETKNELRSLLVKGRDKKYFTSISTKKEIVITLRFGDIKIYGEGKQLRVEIQEQTKRNIVNFKNEIQELTKVYMETEHQTKQKMIVKEEVSSNIAHETNSISPSSTENQQPVSPSIQQTNSQPTIPVQEQIALKDPCFEELAAFAEEVF